MRDTGDKAEKALLLSWLPKSEWWLTLAWSLSRNNARGLLYVTTHWACVTSIFQCQHISCEPGGRRHSAETEMRHCQVVLVFIAGWNNIQVCTKMSEVIHKNVSALTGVAQWVGCCSANQKITNLIPSQDPWLGFGPVTCWGHSRGNPLIFLSHIDLPLFLSPFPSL